MLSFRCFWSITICLILCIFVENCTKKNNTNQAAMLNKMNEFKQTQQATQKPIPLTTTVTTQQIHQWLSCNTLLDSLSIRYLDSFKVSSSTQKIKLQNNFLNEQNKICLQQGLTNGYKEYVWIMNHISKQQNKALLDTMGILVH